MSIIKKLNGFSSGQASEKFPFNEKIITLFQQRCDKLSEKKQQKKFVSKNYHNR